MKLEVNGYIAAEEADANAIKYALYDLHPDKETSLLLHDSEGIYLQANGIPKRGLSLYYVNNLTSVEYASKNKKLKPRAVMRVMRHYLAGNALWRSDIAWLPMTDEAAAERKQMAWQQSQPLLTIMLFIAVGCLPFIFIPLLMINPEIAVLFILTDILAVVGIVLWRRSAMRGNNKGEDINRSPSS